MWQSFHSLRSQRGPRRRGHLGVLGCLTLAALFTGVLIGRLGHDPGQARRVYLEETVPPPAAATRPAPPSERKSRPLAEKIPRQTTPEKAARATPGTVRTPSGLVQGFDVPEDPLLGDHSEGVRVLAGMAGRVVSLTNAARSRHGCRPLRVDDGLTRSARRHSLEMARTGKLVHNSPNGSSPWARMERAGYFWGAAENIGAGYTTPEAAVDGWLDRRDHRRNILNCRLKAIGVGVASGPGGPWWTQDFGTR